MFLKYIKKIFNKKEIDKKKFSNKFKELENLKALVQILLNFIKK